MNLLFVIGCLVSSLWLFKLLGLVRLADEILLAVKKANDIGANTQLDDLSKEQQTQAQALLILKLFAQIFFASLIAFFGPLALVYGLSLMGVVDFNAMVELLVSVPVVVVFTLVMIISWSRMRSG